MTTAPPQGPGSGSATRSPLTGSVSRGIRRGLAWSALSSVLLRVGTFAVGIFLARVFSAEEFGLIAVVLTVQTVLLTVADLGLSTDLIRSPDHQRRTPTVATLAVVVSGLLTLGLLVGAHPLAAALGAADAGPVLAVMSPMLLIAGLGVVPYAALHRDFRQKQVFLAAVADFVVSTVVILALVLAGWGVMALAVARVLAQVAGVAVQFVAAGVRPRFGFDPSVARSVLAFGLPVAAANLVSWLLIGLDKIVLSAVAGATAMGFYFLAFNISNWPMSVLGQVVRSVSLPAFARVAEGTRDRTLAVALAPVWAVAVLAGLLLGILAAPVIHLVYGSRWLAAAPILMVLGGFGALRTAIDLATSYLLARGRSTPVLWLQVAWLLLLVPLLVLGSRQAGGVGAAIGQLAASVAMVALFGRTLARSGVDVSATWAAFWPPLAAAVPAALAAWAAGLLAAGTFADLALGGFAGAAVYAAVSWRWFATRLDRARRLGEQDPLTPQEQSRDAEDGRQPITGAPGHSKDET